MGMWHSNRHLLGIALNTFPSVGGSGSTINHKISAAVLPGSAPYGPRDGWCCREGFGPLQGRFTGQASTLSAGVMGWDRVEVSLLVLRMERHCAVGDS